MHHELPYFSLALSMDVAYIYFADITQGNRSITDADVTQYYYKYMSSDIDNDEISYFVTLKNIVQQFKYEDRGRFSVFGAFYVGGDRS